MNVCMCVCNLVFRTIYTKFVNDISSIFRIDDCGMVNVFKM